MIQIIVTLGAFALFCIAFFFMRLFGVEWTMEQPLSRCVGYMVASRTEFTDISTPRKKSPTKTRNTTYTTSIDPQK